MTFRTRRLSAFLVSILLVAAFGVSPALVASDPLAAVRARFAPDKRLAVFDVSVEKSGEVVRVRGEVETREARDAALEAVRATGSGKVIDEITVLPDPALGAETQALVRVSVANVRGKPAHSAEMVTQTLMGWPVRVLKRQNGWYFVHTEPDGYLGWIEELQLARMRLEERLAWESASLVVAMAPFTTVRAAPSDAADAVSDLVIGALVKALPGDAGWIEVALPDGRRGYVPERDVRDYATWKASRNPIAENVERTALQFMGAPYLWGGTSSKGFDCSGFAKIVLHLNGVDLPRDTDQQAQVGEPVPLDGRLTALRKGDLLFFGTAAADGKPERVTHVGIHLGGLEFIHASGLVRRNSLDPKSPIYSESLRNRLLRARRVLTGGREVTEP